MPKVFLTGKEEPRCCEFCKEVKELRPYGPHGESICFDCMKKDEPAAERQFAKRFETDAVEAIDIMRPGKH